MRTDVLSYHARHCHCPCCRTAMSQAHASSCLLAASDARLKVRAGRRLLLLCTACQPTTHRPAALLCFLIACWSTGCCTLHAKVGAPGATARIQPCMHACMHVRSGARPAHGPLPLLHCLCCSCAWAAAAHMVSSMLVVVPHCSMLNGSPRVFEVLTLCAAVAAA